MNSDQQRLQTIVALGLEISQVKDVDLLLEKILREARRFTSADAGSIYIREGDRLKFSYTQNATLEKELLPGKKLIFSAFTIPIDGRSIAGYVAQTGQFLNIPDVDRLPAGEPYAFNRSYDELSGYRTRSVLAFPLTTNRNEVVGVLQLINSTDPAGGVVPFVAADEPLLLYFANNAALAVERAKLVRGVILRMNKMAELRDPKETGPHVNRVASYAVAIYETWATRRGVPVEEIDRNRDVLRMAAMLHDVGKVAISDTILKKPARFTQEEFEIMKQHTVLGARLFDELYSDFDEAAAIVALNHHERWDGTGYPGHVNPRDGTPLPGWTGPDGKSRGKRGEEIPLFGRIVAIADVYDALCSRRCYKEPWDQGTVLENLRSEAGRQFDPTLLEAFFDSLEVIHHITGLYPEEEAPEESEALRRKTP